MYFAHFPAKNEEMRHERQRRHAQKSDKCLASAEGASEENLRTVRESIRSKTFINNNEYIFEHCASAKVDLNEAF